MRKLFILTCLIAICNITFAQPKWAKKATKSMFTVKTFAKDGTMIGSTNGFYINENGEGVSCFTPFRGADKAIIIDTQGKEYAVEYIAGANDTYDVIKFQTSNRKAIPLNISTSDANENMEVWLLPYTVKKTPNCKYGKIEKAENISSDHKYYTIKMEQTENTLGCPIMNAEGEVIGIMQQSYQNNDTLCYAVSAKYAKELKLTGLSINDPVLKSTYLKKDLPENVDQAILTLYLAGGSLDSIAYRELVNDFINKFPNSADGYIYRAQNHWQENNFENVDNDIETAIKLIDKKDDAHFTYSKLIFSKEIYKKEIPYEKWNLDKAIKEAEIAYSLNPLPAYKQLKAQILFYQKKYKEAFETYKEITDNGVLNAELFVEQARCKELLNDTLATIALLDSAINTFSKPYLKNAAPYLLTRAQTLHRYGQYRKAVFDYNEYEKLIATGLTDQFYYIRFQSELKGHLFQQALNDISKAIEISPKNTLYYAEKASLEIRVNLLDEAIKTAEQCISIEPQNSDGYLFKGLALCLKGNKTEGIKLLEKAKELGDSQAQVLISKYGE